LDVILGEEIRALRAFAGFKPIKLGIALDSVSATELLDRIKARLRGSAFVSLTAGWLESSWIRRVFRVCSYL